VHDRRTHEAFQLQSLSDVSFRI